MDVLAPFRIAFEGLKPGKHDFEMRVDAEFFDSFPLSELSSVDAICCVELDKIGTTLDCVVKLSGHCDLPCDRCLGPIQLPLAFQERLVVKLGEVTDFESDVWTLGSDVHELDLSQAVFEWCHLALPNRRIHAADAECDEEVTDHIGWQDENQSSGPSEGENDDIDPRWNALKDLK
jgi:uncharacterized metal-binding protein YceD (DUF177 family)